MTMMCVQIGGIDGPIAQGRFLGVWPDTGISRIRVGSKIVEGRQIAPYWYYQKEEQADD